MRDKRNNKYEDGKDSMRAFVGMIGLVFGVWSILDLLFYLISNNKAHLGNLLLHSFIAALLIWYGVSKK